MRIILGVLLMGMAPKNDCGSSKDQPPAVEVPPPAPDATTLEVTALQLVDDYRGNVIGADAKYKNKVLRVSGIVDHVSREGSGAFLDFRVHRDDRVQAHFAKESELGSVKAGTIATVRCFGDGEFGGPQLKSCALEK